MIGFRLGFSSTGIGKSLKRNGVHLRGRNARYDCGHRGNRSFFKTWTPSMSYIVGYTVADGCVRDTKYSVCYKSIDREVLEFIKKTIGVSSEIKSRNGGKIYDFSLYGNEFVRDLIAIGITPRKSLTIELPPVPDQMFFHFLRGLIDGDGSIIHHIGTTQIGVNICGSPYLIPQVADRICILLGIPNPPLHNAGRAVTIQYSGENAAKILKAAYSPRNFAITRKRNAVAEALRDRVSPKKCQMCGGEIANRNPSRTTQQRKFCDGCKINKQRAANRRSYQRRQVGTP